MKLSAIFLLASSTSAFTVLPRVPTTTTTSSALCMAKVGVFFGTSTGNTENAAELIAEQLGAEGPFDVDDGDSIVATFQKYDALVVGTPTWNTGADTERSGTGWDELYYGSMESLQLQGKKVAVFGLGDSVSYAENYADAAGELHDVFENLGCKMFGYVSQEGYLHEDSKSIRGDKFCGLLLDAINQEELTEERVEKWVEQLTEEGFLEGGGAVAPAVSEAAPAAEPAQSASLSDMDALVAKLEAENALLKQQLSEGSALLDQSIESHSSGYKPHTNPKTGKTMWTSPDGRTCYYTDGPATQQSTGVSA